MEHTRVDRWLWAVRVFPTRTSATEACRGGHVEVNRSSAKASARVARGDRVVVRFGGRVRDIEVVEVLARRVSAAVAATCVAEHGTARGRTEETAPVARDRSTGRPTKRDRRALDRLRGR
ncbi:MAG: S4 domain-containing protein [Actinomycetota bacterium]|nr:S4 domain-containing protein [Actinomycetota bacterium]